MTICLVAYIYIYKRRTPTSIYSKLQLLCYFRFSGHKLVHLDLGGAPPKLTYLLQVIPFENHSTLIQNHLLYQILRFHLSLFFFAFAYFYIACHRSCFYLSFMAPPVFHIRLGWQMGKSLFANSSDQDIRSCMYIAAGDLPGFYSKEGFLCQRLICGVQRKYSQSKIKNLESTSKTASVPNTASKRRGSLSGLQRGCFDLETSRIHLSKFCSLQLTRILISRLLVLYCGLSVR